MAASQAIRAFAESAANYPDVEAVTESGNAVLVEARVFGTEIFRLAEESGIEDVEHLISYSTGNSVLVFK